MKKYHVASFSALSGISKYASNFFDLVLHDRGYTRLDYRKSGIVGENTIGLDDLIHIEIGINEEAEIELLYRLINHGHKNIDVTLHDPPFIRWPYFKFRNRLPNYAAKIVQLYLRNLWIGESVFKKVRRFFVLTRKGCGILINRYRLENVFYLPFIINEREIRDPSPFSQNMLFFGFIAKNKGLDYALALHEGLLADYPDSRFFVIGDAANRKGWDYLKKVKSRYIRNVEYMGFVEDSKLADCFDLASIAILPFSAYRSVTAASASVLGAMSMGKVVCATNVNAVSEYIRDGQNGYLLNGNYDKDIGRLRSIMSLPVQCEAVAKTAIDYLRNNHNRKVVGESFDLVDALNK